MKNPAHIKVYNSRRLSACRNACLVYLRAIIFLPAILFIIGCADKTPPSVKTDLNDATLAADSNITALQNQLADMAAENRQLKQQIITISGADPNIRYEMLSRLKRIDLARHTSLFDSNTDGKKDSLVIYLVTVDDLGDRIKIPGDVHVQLWNLNEKPQNAMLAEWRIPPDELSRTWSSNLIHSFYRLTLPLPAGLNVPSKPLTLKLRFTDCLTGRTAEMQQAVE